MKLLGKHILVKQAEQSEMTRGGIYIPEKLLSPSNVGTIINIGTEVDQNLLGKQIMFHVESSKEFEYDNTKGKIIFPTDIIATLN